MSRRILCVVLVCAGGVLVAAGCSKQSTGTYNEQGQLDSVSACLEGGEAFDVCAYRTRYALKLDLFQFGDEVGGIIRYHSFQSMKPDEPLENVFKEEHQRFCVWTNSVLVDSDGSNALRQKNTEQWLLRCYL